MSDDLHTISQQLQNLSEQVDSEFSQFQEQLDRLEGEIADVSDAVETSGQGRSMKFSVSPPDPEIQDIISEVKSRSMRQGMSTQEVADRLDVKERTARNYMERLADELVSFVYKSGGPRTTSKLLEDPDKKDIVV